MALVDLYVIGLDVLDWIVVNEAIRIQRHEAGTVTILRFDHANTDYLGWLITAKAITWMAVVVSWFRVKLGHL